MNRLSGFQGWTTTKIASVKPLGGFRLLIRFSDGTEAERDFSDLAAEPGSLTIPLRDPAYFARAFSVHGALAWPNGLALDSVALYDGLKTAGLLRPTSDAAAAAQGQATKSKLGYEVVDVVRVEPRGSYRLALWFSNGEEGERDFADMVAEAGSMVEPLRDPAFFARVLVDDGVLTWPNGFDLDSIALHDEMKNAGLLRRTAA